MRIVQVSNTLAKVLKANFFAAMKWSKKLPPGICNPAERAMFNDQLFILKSAARFGPIFKVIWSRHLMICIVGNALGRRFLKAHEQDLQGVSVDLTPLFQPGIIRNMDGQPHLQCKQQLVKIFRLEIVTAAQADLQKTIASHLQAYAKAAPETQTPRALKSLLGTIVLDCMIRLFFGVEQGTEVHDALKASYTKFGPHDIIWKIGADQKEAFAAIKNITAGMKPDSQDSQRDQVADCFLREALRLGHDTDAVIGNIIYMVEMGRYDVSGLLRWMLKYLGENRELISEIQTQLQADQTVKASNSMRAVIFETLRLNQSAALVRKTKHALEFDGMAIPAQTYIRVCLWEAHKNESYFSEPFKFVPSRFQGDMPALEAYAPFGLDIHRCLGLDIVISVATLFLTELISNYSFKTQADGPAVLVQTIWEPSPQFSVKISSN